MELSPLPKQQFKDNNGAPLVSGLLYTYIAGTTTKIATYTDSTGGSLNTNPVVLDYRGECNLWLDVTKTYKFVLAPRGDTDPPTKPIWSVDQVSVPIGLGDLTQQIIGGILYPLTPAESAASATPVNFWYPPCYVDRYATNTTPGTTDMTVAFLAAMNVARQVTGGGNVYWGQTGTYLVTSSLPLASFGVLGVNLICQTVEWYGSQVQCLITSTIAGPLFNVSGTNVSSLSVAPLIKGGVIQNLSANAAACVIQSDFSAGLRTQDCWLRAINIGVYAPNGECISPTFYQTVVDCPTGTAIACYRGGFRNPTWISGRAFSAQYAFDVSGDDPTWYGTDSEFCQVVFRHQALTGATFFNCHLESFQCLVTNATTVPINLGGAWVDNASAGVGITTAVKFVGGQVAATNANSNLAVIKSSGGFNYFLEFDSVSMVLTNPVIGNSFAPGVGVALPSGTKIITRNTTGLSVNKPPLDGSSGYMFLNPTAQGWTDTVGLKIGGAALNSKYDFTTYTPTWGSTAAAPAIGNGSITGRYWQDGNKVTTLIVITMGSTTTFGTGTYTFSLPVAAAFTGFGCAKASDTGTANYVGICYVNAGLGTVFTCASPASLWSPTVPFTFGNTDTMEIEISYFV